MLDAVQVKAMKCFEFPKLDELTMVSPKTNRWRDLMFGKLDSEYEHFDDMNAVKSPGNWSFASGAK